MGRKKAERIKLNCENCGKEIELLPSYIKKRKASHYFCGNSCSTTYRNLTNNPAKREEVKKKIGAISKARQPQMKRGKGGRYFDDGVSKPSGKITIANYRERAIEIKGAICERCGSLENIVVHHKDRNRKNNDISNLEVLCMKCHKDEHLDDSLNNLSENVQEETIKKLKQFAEKYNETSRIEQSCIELNLAKATLHSWIKSGKFYFCINPKVPRGFHIRKRNK